MSDINCYFPCVDRGTIKYFYPLENIAFYGMIVSPPWRKERRHAYSSSRTSPRKALIGSYSTRKHPCLCSPTKDKGVFMCCNLFYSFILDASLALFLGQMGFAQACASKLCAAQVGGTQIDTAHVGIAEIGSP